MRDDDLDPGASTQMFQAFVDRYEEPEASPSRWMPTVLAVAAAVTTLAVAWFILGG